MEGNTSENELESNWVGAATSKMKKTQNTIKVKGF